MARRRQSMFRASRGLTSQVESVQAALAAVRSAHRLREGNRRKRLKLKAMQTLVRDVHEQAAEAGGPDAYLERLARAVAAGEVSLSAAEDLARLLAMPKP